MLKKLFTALFLTTLTIQCKAQQAPLTTVNTDVPKLVVGVVVDQMRYDYLTRFYDRFGDEGFKRMMNEGFNCKNNHFNYIPTYTGPGHASVYTGTTPQIHGVISNTWYDKFKDEEVYCASDNNVNPIGTEDRAGKMSPHRLKTMTVADQNRLHTQMRGKTIGISLKDRGAILPAGHTANAAYWFLGKNEGKWITSSHYMKKLPKWVSNFNTSKKADSYLKEWNTLYDIKTYKESGTDSNTFEGGFEGKETATFPYDLKKLKDKNKGYSIIKSTPYGNSLTADFALAAVDGEDLGKDTDTDFLTVSFSSTDYVGHNFGVNSKELEDTYLRLDQDLARLLTGLDAKVGKGNYTVFLTADHGAVHVPAYLKSVKIPAGYINIDDLKAKVNNYVKETFGEEKLIKKILNNQVFFNYEILAEKKIDHEKLQNVVSHFLLQQEKVSYTFTREQLETGNYTIGLPYLIQKGFNQKRSGDVIFVFDPAVIYSFYETGTTHGSGMNYDTHVPLLFYGNGIKKGGTVTKTKITDIAPTISALLGISFPNGATGDVLPFVLK
ncbi:alkaline phosphatase PafA [Aquimarina rhabdastrellae]